MTLTNDPSYILNMAFKHHHYIYEETVFETCNGKVLLKIQKALLYAGLYIGSLKKLYFRFVV